MSKSKRRQQDAKSTAPDIRKVISYAPRNLKQREYLRSISENDITFGIGAAGTGKTYLSAMSAIDGYESGKYEKIIVARPAVPAGGEKIGFLPGNLDEKLDPYMQPIWDAFSDYWSPRTLHLMKMEKQIEVVPYGFMRGRTFRNAFIIADEAQNSTLEQMYMLLTRFGEGSKMVITGDPEQTDVRGNTLNETCRRLSRVSNVGWIMFGSGDVVRHRTVSNIIYNWNRPTEDEETLSEAA